MATAIAGVLINIVTLRLFIILVGVAGGGLAGGESDFTHLEPCEDILDVLTGCGGTVGWILGAVVGQVPGAHWAFNVMMITVTTIPIVTWVMSWARGVKG